MISCCSGWSCYSQPSPAVQRTPTVQGTSNAPGTSATSPPPAASNTPAAQSTSEELQPPVRIGSVVYAYILKPFQPIPLSTISENSSSIASPPNIPGSHPPIFPAVGEVYLETNSDGTVDTRIEWPEVKQNRRVDAAVTPDITSRDVKHVGKKSNAASTTSPLSARNWSSVQSGGARDTAAAAPNPTNRRTHCTLL